MVHFFNKEKICTKEKSMACQAGFLTKALVICFGGDNKQFKLNCMLVHSHPYDHFKNIYILSLTDSPIPASASILLSSTYFCVILSARGSNIVGPSFSSLIAWNMKYHDNQLIQTEDYKCQIFFVNVCVCVCVYECVCACESSFQFITIVLQFN